MYILDESCVDYYHILDLLYVCFSAKNTKKVLQPDIKLQNRKQSKIKGLRTVCCDFVGLGVLWFVLYFFLFFFF